MTSLINEEMRNLKVRSKSSSTDIEEKGRNEDSSGSRKKSSIDQGLDGDPIIISN